MIAIEGRAVTLVDDGLATGSTVIAAQRSIRARNPARNHRRAVGPQETCEAMRAEAGELFCLTMPEFFVAVGLHYRDSTRRPTKASSTCCARGRRGP